MSEIKLHVIEHKPKGPQVICGLSLGVAQRRTVGAILAVNGEGTDAVFEVVFIHEFDGNIKMADLTSAIAQQLKLDALRRTWPTFRNGDFQSVPDLIIDITDSGERPMVEFERMKDSGDLEVDELVSIVTTNGESVSPWNAGNPNYRIPETHLMSCLKLAAEGRGTPRFAIRQTKAGDTYDPHVPHATLERFKRELREYTPRTVVRDAAAAVPEAVTTGILRAVAAAVWRGEREPPAPIIFGSRSSSPFSEFINRPDPFMTRPGLDMTKHYTGVAPHCSCGFSYLSLGENQQCVLKCPKCGNARCLGVM
ncbi:MAG TPA: hypothetical protein VI756_14185 [Blastocatellia bacterium]